MLRPYLLLVVLKATSYIKLSSKVAQVDSHIKSKRIICWSTATVSYTKLDLKQHKLSNRLKHSHRKFDLHNSLWKGQTKSNATWLYGEVSLAACRKTNKNSPEILEWMQKLNYGLWLEVMVTHTHSYIRVDSWSEECSFFSLCLYFVTICSRGFKISPPARS